MMDEVHFSFATFQCGSKQFFFSPKCTKMNVMQQFDFPIQNVKLNISQDPY